MPTAITRCLTGAVPVLLSIVLFVVLTESGRASTCAPIQLGQVDPDTADIFVAPWGADVNSGTRASPVRTLGRAARLAQGKELIVVRGGIYREAQTVFHGGNASKPLSIVAHPGEQPVFDGAGLSIRTHVGLIQVYASHLIFDGLEIRNSSGRGFSSYNADNVVLRRSNIHHIQHKGYAGSGDNLVVEQNRFRDLALSSRYGNTGRPWDGGVSTWMKPNGQRVRNTVVRDNYISRVWGECVIPLFSVGARVTGNIIKDCYSVSVYADNASDLVVDRNIIGRTSNEFRRRDNGLAAVGVGLAVEKYSIGAFRLDRIAITNNLILGSDRGVSFYDDPQHAPWQNSYRHVTIAHNIICGNRAEAIKFPAARGSWPYANVIRNNILCGGQVSGALTLGQYNAWSISNNAYPDGIPPLDRHSWISGDVGYVTGYGSNRSDYRLRSNSRLRGAGAVIAQVAHDADCARRSENTATIGLYN